MHLMVNKQAVKNYVVALVFYEDGPFTIDHWVTVVLHPLRI